MQAIFPNALSQTGVFVSGINLPLCPPIAGSLSNELDGLERDFVLVLDDYHTIREQSIHELLSILLQHLPKGLRLVMTTRRTPRSHRCPLGCCAHATRLPRLGARRLTLVKITRLVYLPVVSSCFSPLGEAAHVRICRGVDAPAKIKLHIPRSGFGAVARPRLVARLNEARKWRPADCHCCTGRLRQEHAPGRLGQLLWAAGGLALARSA